jgi:hypothetical protein
VRLPSKIGEHLRRAARLWCSVGRGSRRCCGELAPKIRKDGRPNRGPRAPAPPSARAREVLRPFARREVLETLPGEKPARAKGISRGWRPVLKNRHARLIFNATNRALRPRRIRAPHDPVGDSRHRREGRTGPRKFARSLFRFVQLLRTVSAGRVSRPAPPSEDRLPRALD